MKLADIQSDPLSIQRIAERWSLGAIFCELPAQQWEQRFDRVVN